MGNSQDQLLTYLARGRDSVSGWFARIDAEIFRVLLVCQGEQRLPGSVAEIGVHHGKCFIGLCLSLQLGEKAYCVDLFENQHLNIDGSGKGNKDIFENNLHKHEISLSRLVIRTASSMDVTAAEILGEVGPVRFFSIDGGHWSAVVRHDLALADASLNAHGIVALDDFLRPEWPEVSEGYFAWKSEGITSLVPLCIGYNKLYLCHEAWRLQYQSALLKDPILQYLNVKTARFQGIDLPVFSQFFMPDSGLFDKRLTVLRLLHPDYYIQLRRLYSKARNLFRR